MITKRQSTIAVPASFVTRLDAVGRMLQDLAKELDAHRQLIPKDQAWFWSQRWQALEREADRALAQGDYDEFEDVDEAITWLHAQA